jgi:hypothetical protein
LRLAGHVHWCRIGDYVVILDERAGRYVAVTAAAVSVWEAIAAGDLVARDEVTEGFAARGWLVLPGQEGIDLRRGAGPGVDFVPVALLCLLQAFFDVRYRGFAASYQRARDACREVPPGAGLERALDRFQRAERFVPSARGLEDCLPRSLGLFSYLRRRGLEVRHRIGVKLYPFGAHAWVEVPGGDVMLDDRKRVAAFTPIATLG